MSFASLLTGAVGSYRLPEALRAKPLLRHDSIVCGFAMLRLGLVVALCWIGALKAANYEAQVIVPFVANSPLVSFFYHHPAAEYRPAKSG